MPEDYIPHASVEESHLLRLARERQEAQIAREAAELQKQAADRAATDIPQEPGDEATRANRAASNPHAGQEAAGAASAARRQIDATTDVGPLLHPFLRLPDETDEAYLRRYMLARERGETTWPDAP